MDFADMDSIFRYPVEYYEAAKQATERLLLDGRISLVDELTEEDIKNIYECVLNVIIKGPVHPEKDGNLLRVSKIDTAGAYSKKMVEIICDPKYLCSVAVRHKIKYDDGIVIPAHAVFKGLGYIEGQQVDENHPLHKVNSDVEKKHLQELFEFYGQHKQEVKQATYDRRYGKPKPSKVEAIKNVLGKIMAKKNVKGK